jgi:hypothetical protein
LDSSDASPLPIFFQIVLGNPTGTVETLNCKDVSTSKRDKDVVEICAPRVEFAQRSSQNYVDFLLLTVFVRTKRAYLRRTWFAAN